MANTSNAVDSLSDIGTGNIVNDLGLTDIVSQGEQATEEVSGITNNISSIDYNSIDITNYSIHTFASLIGTMPVNVEGTSEALNLFNMYAVFLSTWVNSSNILKQIVGWVLMCLTGLPTGIACMFNEGLTKVQDIALVIMCIISFITYGVIVKILKTISNVSRERKVKQLTKKLNRESDGAKYY